MLVSLVTRCVAVALMLWQTTTPLQAPSSWSRASRPLQSTSRGPPCGSPQADLFFQYAVAGPSFISETSVDNHELGHRFTFQNFMAIGTFIGPGRKVTAGIKINHYSNGNIFTENAGVKVPLTLTVGYVF